MGETLKLQIQLNIYFGPIVPNLPAWSFGYLTYQHHTQLFYFGNMLMKVGGPGRAVGQLRGPQRRRRTSY